MSDRTTLTVRLPLEVKKQLGRLASHTKRTRSHLAGEAITSFVKRELTIVEGIKRSLEDMNRGRVVPHKTAMRRLRSTVARVSKEKP
jgi:predicted transcriptional regulator